MPKFYPDEVREKAVRLVVDHRGDYPSEWAAIKTVAERIGANPETVRNWVRKTQATTKPAAVQPFSEDMAAELKALRRKNRELEKTVEILKAATSFFARECDPPQK
ncbi:transposase [Nocardia fluminea]|uniref:Transposase n=1 Tax=Nocardia fluminea TaxID=134984 RepID=A0A2N3VLV4_9NOCA|nr:transposase [Nocardia fluminea]